jgi:predicted class III extradiol MEMO1 family dioxygenase
MVGAIDQEQEEEYGKILAPYLERDDTLFVISSDFCHWCVCFSGARCIDIWYIGATRITDTRSIIPILSLAMFPVLISAEAVRARRLLDPSTRPFQIWTTKR